MALALYGKFMKIDSRGREACQVGTYFNPDNESFRQASRSRIYIDKTGLLKHMNQVLGTEEKCIALSHARRFGKSQAAGMIDAYYSLGSDSKDLFAGYEIAEEADFLTHLNRYNVIHLDISSFVDMYREDIIDQIWKAVYREIQLAYPDILDRPSTIGAILMDLYEKSGIPIIIIIDEWDAIIRNYSDDPDLVHRYLQFLHTLFKSEESKKFLSLAYITGILPIKKIKDESALNNFREYTMLNSRNLTRYFGFTEEEVRSLCNTYHMNFESVRQWYDGYLINGIHMYNPNSVYQAMVDQSLESYWRDTSAFDSLNQYITLNYDGLKEDILTMLGGQKVDVDTETFQNDLSVIDSKDEVLTALIHLGYLGYDREDMQAYIPNYEVAKAYQSALKKSGWSKVAEAISQCDILLRETLKRNQEKVADMIEQAHEAYTSIINYNDENALSCVVTMAYFTAPAYYKVLRELPSGKGYADIALIPRIGAGAKPAMILELKWDQSADSAIRQIKERRYKGVFRGYTEEVLLVGVNYDKQSKKHDCIIESCYDI